MFRSGNNMDWPVYNAAIWFTADLCKLKRSRCSVCVSEIWNTAAEHVYVTCYSFGNRLRAFSRGVSPGVLLPGYIVHVLFVYFASIVAFLDLLLSVCIVPAADRVASPHLPHWGCHHHLMFYVLVRFVYLFVYVYVFVYWGRRHHLAELRRDVGHILVRRQCHWEVGGILLK